MRPHASIPVAALALAALSFVGTAHAERRNPLEGQPPERHKVEMRALRFEITPQFVVSLNQDFRHFIGGGLTLQFHITDWLGIQGQFAYGGGINTSLTDALAGANGALPDMEGNAQPSKQQFLNHIATINMLISAAVAITPFQGKQSLFGALFLRYDAYALAGVGMMNLTNSFDPGSSPDPSCSATTPDPNVCDPKNAGLKVGGMLGVGVHLYFTDWIGLNIELRDFLAATNMGGFVVTSVDRRITSGDEQLNNNLFVNVGVSIMLPPSAKISP